jgi:hypothetical protein
MRSMVISRRRDTQSECKGSTRRRAWRTPEGPHVRQFYGCFSCIWHEDSVELVFDEKAITRKFLSVSFGGDTADRDH